MSQFGAVPGGVIETMANAWWTTYGTPPRAAMRLCTYMALRTFKGALRDLAEEDEIFRMMEGKPPVRQEDLFGSRA